MVPIYIVGVIEQSYRPSLIQDTTKTMKSIARKPSQFRLTNNQFDGLLKLSTVYNRQARLCLKAGAYLAGTAMVGAALEAILICMVHLESRKFSRWASRPNKPFKRWDLGNLLQAADYAGWLPRGLPDEDDFDHKRAKLGDYADLIRRARNLIHPFRHLADFENMRMTKKRLSSLLEIHEVVSSNLQAINDASLRRKLGLKNAGQ